MIFVTSESDHLLLLHRFIYSTAKQKLQRSFREK